MGKISNIRVPNLVPKEFDILFLGEFPNEVEELNRQPFTGPAGDMLMSELNRNGVYREQVALCNLSQYKPQYNNFENLFNSYELTSGQNEITQIIEDTQPNLIVPLGSHALEFITDFKAISKYRGSILTGHPLCSKVIPTYHPSYIVHSPEHYPEFSKDIERIIQESKSPDLNLTPRNYYIPPGQNILQIALEMAEAKILAVDIETVKNTFQILCVGFADSAGRALCLPWNVQYQSLIIQLLTCPAEKIFQNGIFDVPQLHLNGVEVVNYKHDTLLMHFALEPELPRSLEYLTSIYTREPYYKDTGRGEIPDDTKVWSDKVDKNKLYVYNCKDCCVTFEIYEKLWAELQSDSIAMNVYLDRLDSQHTAMHITNAGGLIDLEKLNYFKLALTYKWNKLQFALNVIAVTQKFPVPKKGLNVNSKTVVPKFLYDTLKLPTRRTRDGKITTDEDAIVSLITFCENKINESKKEDTKSNWKFKQEACKLILEIRGIRKLLSSYINITISSDGRARSSIRVGATETGRWAASKYVDGSGLNSMTLPRDAIVLSDVIPENFDPFTMLDQLNKEDEDDNS